MVYVTGELQMPPQPKSSFAGFKSTVTPKKVTEFKKNLKQLRGKILEHEDLLSTEAELAEKHAKAVVEALPGTRTNSDENEALVLRVHTKKKRASEKAEFLCKNLL